MSDNTRLVIFNDQSTDYFRELSKTHSDVLVFLNSGSSFRNNFCENYIPKEAILPKIERFPNIRYFRWTDLEAEDLKYLWTVKHVGTPELSLKTQIRKVLDGYENKGVPKMAKGYDVHKLLNNISVSWSTPKALNYICEELKLPYDRILLNHKLLNKDIELYREGLEDFDKLYARL